MKHLEQVKLYSVTDETLCKSKWIAANTSLLAKMAFIKLFPESTLDRAKTVDMTETPSSDYEVFVQDYSMGKVSELQATGYLTWDTSEQNWQLDFYPKSQ